MRGSPLVPGGLSPEYASALAEVHTDMEHVNNGNPLDQPPTIKPALIDHLISGALSVLIKWSELREAVRRFRR